MTSRHPGPDDDEDKEPFDIDNREGKSDGSDIPRGATGLPKLVEFVALHAGVGFAIGVIFSSAIIYFDIAGLKALLTESSDPYTPMVLLYASNGLFFAGINTAAEVMLIPWDKSGGAPD